MASITNGDQFIVGVGQVMCYCQCIEHDIKLIYASMSLTPSEEIRKWTLGQTVESLADLERGRKDPFFTREDYRLLRKLTAVRNFYAHECYVDWVYDKSRFKEAAEKLGIAVDKLQAFHAYIVNAKSRCLSK